MARAARWLKRGSAALLGAGVCLLGSATLATLAARYALARPSLLNHVRAFNRRYLNPLTLGAAGQRGVYYQALRHVGRRSGRVYTTPLEALPVRGGFVIPMTYGMRADWARNTLAAGGATLLRDGEALALTRPRIVRLETVSGELPPVERLGLWLLGIRDLLLLERADTPAANG